MECIVWSPMECIVWSASFAIVCGLTYLLQPRSHHNASRVFFPDHSPEILHGIWQRALRSNIPVVGTCRYHTGNGWDSWQRFSMQHFFTLEINTTWWRTRVTDFRRRAVQTSMHWKFHIKHIEESKNCWQYNGRAWKVGHPHSVNNLSYALNAIVKLLGVIPRFWKYCPISGMHLLFGEIVAANEIRIDEVWVRVAWKLWQLYASRDVW